MKDKKVFGSFIKQKRIEKNYSQKDLADLLFVTESAVSKWERGVTYPDITLITDICRVLDITEHELIESSHDTEYRNMQKDANRFNKIKKVLFWIFNITYSVALVTCFIVNLSVNHTLSWVFIVFASLVVAYTFCPTVTFIFKKYKLLVFLGSTFLSLFLLFLTISIYTSDYWFMIPTFGLLIGYFIIFYPILFFKQKDYMEEETYNKFKKWFLLTYSFGILILLDLLLVMISIYTPINLGMALLIGSSILLLPLLFGLLVALTKGGGVIKIVLFSLIGLVALSIIVSVIRSLYLLSTEVTSTYDIKEEYNDIQIDTRIHDINISFTNDSTNKVIYTENKDISLDVRVENGTLKISNIDNRKFYFMMFDLGKKKVDIYLSKDLINSLNIKSKTSDITISSGFSFNDAIIDNSTGDISFKSNVLNDLTISASTGNIELSNVNVGGSLKTHTSTGRNKFTGVQANKLEMESSTGGAKLSNTIITTEFIYIGSTGNLTLDGFDSDTALITLSTGGVTGTVLSTKFFIASSGTGHVSVPPTKDGETYRIETSTGNIEITYKN